MFRRKTQPSEPQSPRPVWMDRFNEAATTIRSFPHPSAIADRLSELEGALVATDEDIAQLTKSIDQLNPEHTASQLKQALGDARRHAPIASSSGDEQRLEVLRRRYDTVNELMNRRDDLQRHIADSIAHIELLAVESIRNAALSIDQRQPVDAVLEQLAVDVEALRLAREELKAW